MAAQLLESRFYPIEATFEVAEPLSDAGAFFTEEASQGAALDTDGVLDDRNLRSCRFGFATLPFTDG